MFKFSIFGYLYQYIVSLVVARWQVWVGMTISSLKGIGKQTKERKKRVRHRDDHPTSIAALSGDRRAKYDLL